MGHSRSKSLKKEDEDEVSSEVNTPLAVVDPPGTPEIIVTCSEENLATPESDLSQTLLTVEGDYCLRGSREMIYPQASTLLEAGLEDIEIEVKEDNKDVAEYCLFLLGARFQGQTTKSSQKSTDETDTTDVLNLGTCLSLVDKFIKGFKQVTDFKGVENDYKMLLFLIARKRCRCDKNETTEECQEKLLEQSERFVKVYHQRGEFSEDLEHPQYWGTKQQLLSGKVIADYVDEENGPLDPIFGVLLQPTAGRVGPGNSDWVHKILFDENKHMAFHSAVHDAFGYLMNNHSVGPGYDYMKGSTWFSTYNPLAGQTPGIAFWKDALEDIQKKQKVLKYWML